MLLKLGSKGPDVQKLQRGLAAFGFHPGAADGAFGAKTKDALDDWQADVGLYPDGVFGSGSLLMWNSFCDNVGFPEYKFLVPAPADDPPDQPTKLTWVSCPVDPWGSGFTNCTLRSDTAEAFTKLCAEVHDLGGIVTTAGGRRQLSTKAGPSSSPKSFHYVGRAFDLALPSGMQNPDKDPYIVVRDGDSRLWTICAKVLDDEAPRAMEVPTVTLRATVCKSLRNSKGELYTQLSYQTWTGRAFNLTSLCRIHGFERIPGRKAFFAGGTYTGAEWWHFQWERGLTKGMSTFGEELLKVYPMEEAQKFVYWDEAKDSVFGLSWF